MDFRTSATDRRSKAAKQGESRARRTLRASIVIAIVAMAIGAFASSASAFPKYSFSFSLGSEGSGPGQFNTPEGMTTDSAGNVYVADYSNNRIQVFNSKGEFQKEFGSSKLGSPTDVAIDSKGNFWVTQELDNESIHKVVKFNSNGEYLSTFGSFGTGNGKFWNPGRVDIDSKDNLWISDSGNGRVQQFNAEGKYVRQINTTTVGKEFIPGGSVAIDSKDNVWVVDWASEDILGFNSEGNYVGEVNLGAFNLPNNGLAVDAEDRVWVAAGDEKGNYLLTFNSKGEKLGQVGELEPEGVLFQPEDIGFDPSGNPWVRNYTNSKIMKWMALPDATTNSVTDIKSTEVTLNGTINPNGNHTTYQFEYGTTQAFGSTAPIPAKDAGSGKTSISVSQTISGLTSNTYHYFRVVAQSSAGTVFGQTKLFKSGSPPKNSVIPTIHSNSVPAEAVPMTTFPGIWSGVPAPTFTYQWKRCNGAGVECVNIGGATADAYTPVAADAEHTLVVEVTAKNSSGTATASSKATAKVKPLGQIAEFSLPEGGHLRRSRKEVMVTFGIRVEQFLG